MLDRLRTAHDARASELKSLIVGSSKRIIRGDDGEALEVEEISRYPSCPTASETVLRDRTYSVRGCRPEPSSCSTTCGLTTLLRCAKL